MAFSKRGGGSDFSHQKGVIDKKGVSFISILSSPFQCLLYLSGWCVCVCVFCLFPPFLSIFFVFQGKKLCLIESNHQICDFYK